MTPEEVLRVEYEQQYEQYRWIGRQQILVFTFYAAIIAATFALMGAFFKDTSVENVVPWFLCILIFLGIMGVSISFALIRSRAMQIRTAIYLLELLIQMTEQLKLEKPAIRFRNLPATGGKFSPLDTVYITISLAFVFGIALILAAIALFIGTQTCIGFLPIAICWLVSVIFFSLLGIYCILPKILDKENENVRTEHSKLEQEEKWAERLREKFNIKRNGNH